MADEGLLALSWHPGSDWTHSPDRTTDAVQAGFSMEKGAATVIPIGQ